MSDIAEKILTAIEAKEIKARAAASTTYDDEGERVPIPESLIWTVQDDEQWGTTWVGDGARENVALASDVDMISETWDQIPPGRIEFIADNDPESVLRRCAADREIVEKYQELDARRTKFADRSRGEGKRLTEIERMEWHMLDHEADGLWYAVEALARGYGVQP